jgi:hypothetical protein
MAVDFDWVLGAPARLDATREDGAATVEDFRASTPVLAEG